MKRVYDEASEPTQRLLKHLHKHKTLLGESGSLTSETERQTALMQDGPRRVSHLTLRAIVKCS